MSSVERVGGVRVEELGRGEGTVERRFGGKGFDILGGRKSYARSGTAVEQEDGRAVFRVVRVCICLRLVAQDSLKICKCNRHSHAALDCRIPQG